MEVKEILETIGYTPKEGEELTSDVLSKHINSVFINKKQLSTHPEVEALINKSVGSRFGKAETDMIKRAKEMGVEITHGEFEGKKFEEVNDAIFSRIKSVVDAKPPGKDAKEWEDKIAKIRGEADTFAKSVGEWEGKYNDLNQSIEQTKLDAVKNAAFNSGLQAVKWVNGVLDVSKKGLEYAVRSEYDFDPDGDIVYALPKSGEFKGKRVQSPKSPAKTMTVSDAIELVARRENLWSDSPHEGKPGAKPATPIIARPANANTKERKASAGFLAGMKQG